MRKKNTKGGWGRGGGGDGERLCSLTNNPIHNVDPCSGWGFKPRYFTKLLFYSTIYYTFVHVFVVCRNVRRAKECYFLTFFLHCRLPFFPEIDTCLVALLTSLKCIIKAVFGWIFCFRMIYHDTGIVMIVMIVHMLHII